MSFVMFFLTNWKTITRTYTVCVTVPFFVLKNELLEKDQYISCAENGEGIQVLRYQTGQKYEGHFGKIRVRALAISCELIC